MSTYSSHSPSTQPHGLLEVEDLKHHKHSKHHHHSNNISHKHTSKTTSSSSTSSTNSHPTTPTSFDPTATTSTTTKKATYLRKSIPLYQPPIPTLPRKNNQSAAVCKDAMYIPSTMKIFTPHNYDLSSIPATPITDTYSSSSTPTTTSILQYENTLVTTPNSDNTDTDNDWLRIADGLYESIVASKLALKQKLKDEFYGTKYSTKTKKNKGEKRSVGVDTLDKSDNRGMGHNSDLSPRPPSVPKPSASANTATARYQRRNLSHTTVASIASINATSNTDVDPLLLTDSVIEMPATITTTTPAYDPDLANVIDTGTQAYDPTTITEMNTHTHTLAPSSSRRSDSATVVGRHNHHQPSMPLTNRVAIDTNLLAWFCAHPRRHTLSSPPVTLHQPAVLIARRRIKQQYLTLGSVPGSLPATHRSTRVADDD